MGASAGDLAAGQRALEEARWAAARSSFEAVLASGESAVAREGLGLALWFQGHVADGIASRERAFELHVRDGRCDDAARTAVWVSHQHFVARRVSAARGWLARAERALEGAPECVGHGWVAVERARHGEDPDQQASYALEAVAVARRLQAPDLETFALSVVGRARVEAGRVEEGLLLLEEAMAGAVCGQVRNVHTLAEAYCNLIIASTGAGDWPRATEWCEHVDTFARANRTAPLFATCRGVHADVLIATGHWAEAEDALATALATHAGHVPELGAPAVASLAALRVRQGRLDEAEALLVGRDEDPAALWALALLRIAEGHPVAAVSLLERALRQVHGGAHGGVLPETRLRATLVAARLGCADLPGAREASGALRQLATASGIRVVSAHARLAAAQVARASGSVAETAQAAELAGQALAAFLSLAMPLDAADSRLELARALAQAAPEVAVDEARTALAVFQRLGAVDATASAASLLLTLTAPPGAGATSAPGHPLLTPREQEVLELVARGLSNAGIAASLVISEKTVGHHVSHILTKLGVHNRTEAAAHVHDRR